MQLKCQIPIDQLHLNAIAQHGVVISSQGKRKMIWEQDWLI